MLKAKKQRFKYLSYRSFHITFLKEEFDSPEHEVTKFLLPTRNGL